MPRLGPNPTREYFKFISGLVSDYFLDMQHFAFLTEGISGKVQ